jgi:hypothetical protein
MRAGIKRALKSQIHSLPAFVSFVLVAAFSCYGQNTGQAPSAGQAPLRLAQTYPLPSDVRGNFDHLEVDLKRKRLFATPEDYKAVLVLDVETGKVIHKIDGILRPHAVHYRADIDRLYITDGGDGSVKVYDGETYHQLSRIPLLKDADSIGFDISRHYLYVDNGGRDVGQSYSMLSVIDEATQSKLTDMRIEGDTLEAMALDNYRPRIYVNDLATSQVVVVDRFRNSIMRSGPSRLASKTSPWPLTSNIRGSL